MITFVEPVIQSFEADELIVQTVFTQLAPSKG